MQASDRFNINSQLEHLQAKYVGTGHADLSRFEWAVNIQRDSYASYIGHYPMLSYFGIAENESIGLQLHAENAITVWPSSRKRRRLGGAVMISFIFLLIRNLSDGMLAWIQSVKTVKFAAIKFEFGQFDLILFE